MPNCWCQQSGPIQQCVDSEVSACRQLLFYRHTVKPEASCWYTTQKPGSTACCRTCTSFTVRMQEMSTRCLIADLMLHASAADDPAGNPGACRLSCCCAVFHACLLDDILLASYCNSNAIARIMAELLLGWHTSWARVQHHAPAQEQPQVADRMPTSPVLGHPQLQTISHGVPLYGQPTGSFAGQDWQAGSGAARGQPQEPSVHLPGSEAVAGDLEQGCGEDQGAVPSIAAAAGSSWSMPGSFRSVWPPAKPRVDPATAHTAARPQRLPAASETVDDGSSDWPTADSGGSKQEVATLLQVRTASLQ
jgi:hypothetical protein